MIRALANSPIPLPFSNDAVNSSVKQTLMLDP
jgi:hypothetical protein